MNFWFQNVINKIVSEIFRRRGPISKQGLGMATVVMIQGLTNNRLQGNLPEGLSFSAKSWWNGANEKVTVSVDVEVLGRLTWRSSGAATNYLEWLTNHDLKVKVMVGEILPCMRRWKEWRADSL